MTTSPIGAAHAPIIPIQQHLADSLRPRGVRVHAIGPIRVQHGRLPIHSLGGPKAGAKQALGLFAFLFDRGPQGIEKDEAVELIWPDASISVADTAFHRTLLGLRGSLRAGGMGDAVEFRNGRYVLASGLVSWSDVWELERMLDGSASTAGLRARMELLEACRSSTGPITWTTARSLAPAYSSRPVALCCGRCARQCSSSSPRSTTPRGIIRRAEADVASELAEKIS